MTSWVDLCSRAARIVLAAIWSVVLWTVWLALLVVLSFQLYIVTANELEIPDFVLRRLESKLEASGVRATFSRTSFDPAGRVLIENVRLSLPAFAEPIVTCRSVYFQLNLWYLLMGQMEPRELRLTGISAFVPAMLSPSGEPEEIVHNVDATLEAGHRSVALHQLSGTVAGVPLCARGTVTIAPGADEKPGLDKLAEFVRHMFPQVCRQAIAVREQVNQFDDPILQLELAPSESGAVTIQVLALARSANLRQPAAEAVDLRASTRLLLFGDAPPSNVEFSAAEVRVPGDTRITGLHARITGRLRLAGAQFDLREVAATADAVSVGDIDVRTVAARIFPRPLPLVEVHAVADVVGSPLSVRADGDVTARSGVVRFEGAISPRVVDVVQKRVSADVRKYADFETVIAERAEARFGPNLKFEKLTATVQVPRIHSHGVTMKDGRADIELDPQRLYSPDAFARVGDNFAHGTYEHDLKTNHYRFLLEGRLRPLDISEWFRDWWTHFFGQFKFRGLPPVANVDVRGSWRDGRQSNVFVFAEVPAVTIRGTDLDRVRTRLFIRPAFFDGLEVLATRGKGNAHGRFTYVGDPETHAWHTLELGMDSNLDLSIPAQLLGEAGARTLAPFRLAQPPELKVRGQFAGPDAPGGASEKLRIQARTAGEFRFHDFPLHDVSFIATIDRDEVILDDVEALFAGGVATGHARVWGMGKERRLGFDFALDDASLGKVAAGLNEFFAAKKNEAPAPPGRFVQEKANVRLNFAASAEGRYDDALSYRGAGSAVLRGAEIGEVPLLGTLSELLKFTALRFTEARANFRIENARLVFPEVTLRGSNSAIDAHGTYAMDRRELEFNAKIFPFQESENLIKTVVGAVLTPLSNAFEVKLTGSLAKPQWAFVIGPTNFLRSLAPGADSVSKGELPPETKPSAPTQPPGQEPPSAGPPPKS